ncbi:hypothetical protein Y032_0084g1701 [Ancylostoma ceylanicum]|uniref:Uncharacterized protein n=1 Tax=Ancylostoma ceylanicum TaxID=53326 RepID=A0A016TQH0_9BILA|nr:hypothetical protein Y032_0084g1701 [Ancylostoma ceylanicum]
MRVPSDNLGSKYPISGYSNNTGRLRISQLTGLPLPQSNATTRVPSNNLDSEDPRLKVIQQSEFRSTF